MKIARILSPITALGPGRRVGVWCQGCKKKCECCISPEMQPDDLRKNIPIEILTKIVVETANRDGCDALTISGGDPLEQSWELKKFLEALRGRFEDILLYTGFTYEEIMRNKMMLQCIDLVDVLIDGRYVREENQPICVLRGSLNQRIIYINKQLEQKYTEYIKKGRMTESFVHGDHIISVGIRGRGIEE